MHSRRQERRNYINTFMTSCQLIFYVEQYRQLPQASNLFAANRVLLRI